jgi:hypothetical protein
MSELCKAVGPMRYYLTSNLRDGQRACQKVRVGEASGSAQVRMTPWSHLNFSWHKTPLIERLYMTKIMPHSEFTLAVLGHATGDGNRACPRIQHGEQEQEHGVRRVNFAPSAEECTEDRR